MTTLPDGQPNPDSGIAPGATVDGNVSLSTSGCSDPLGDSAENSLFRPRTQTFLPFRPSAATGSSEPFAMQDILDLREEDTSSTSLPASVLNSDTPTGEDPVQCGLVKLPIAQTLFDR